MEHILLSGGIFPPFLEQKGRIYFVQQIEPFAFKVLSRKTGWHVRLLHFK